MGRASGTPIGVPPPTCTRFCKAPSRPTCRWSSPRSSSWSSTSRPRRPSGSRCRPRSCSRRTRSSAERRSSCTREAESEALGAMREGARPWTEPLPESGPNKAVEPTPSSVRCAPASGRGSPRAFGLCEKTLASSVSRLFPMDCGTLALVFFIGLLAEASYAKSEETIDATCVDLGSPWNAYCWLRSSRYSHRRNKWPYCLARYRSQDRIGRRPDKSRRLSRSVLLYACPQGDSRDSYHFHLPQRHHLCH